MCLCTCTPHSSACMYTFTSRIWLGVAWVCTIPTPWRGWILFSYLLHGQMRMYMFTLWSIVIVYNTYSVERCEYAWSHLLRGVQWMCMHINSVEWSDCAFTFTAQGKWLYMQVFCMAYSDCAYASTSTPCREVNPLCWQNWLSVCFHSVRHTLLCMCVHSADGSTCVLTSILHGDEWIPILSPLYGGKWQHPTLPCVVITYELTLGHWIHQSNHFAFCGTESMHKCTHSNKSIQPIPVYPSQFRSIPA